MIIMNNGLQKCPFIFSLGKREPVNFSEILDRAEKHAHTEEAYDAHDPPFTPMTKERFLAQEFQSRRVDHEKGR